MIKMCRCVCVCVCVRARARTQEYRHGVVLTAGSSYLRRAQQRYSNTQLSPSWFPFIQRYLLPVVLRECLDMLPIFGVSLSLTVCLTHTRTRAHARAHARMHARTHTHVRSFPPFSHCSPSSQTFPSLPSPVLPVSELPRFKTKLCFILSHVEYNSFQLYN